MLSRSSESPDDEGDFLHEFSEGSPSTVSRSIQDDVERLIEIALQLFSAIERQIHEMEEELLIARGEQFRPHAQTVFKERLISCARSLDASIKEIAVNLERPGIQQTASQ
jgi:hypothetical protein